MKIKPNIVFILCLFLCSAISYSQQISGKVYDDEGIVSGATITNLSNHTSTVSNENGDFILKAELKDSIRVSSLFHKPKNFIIREIHVKNEEIVIELIKNINDLEEVKIVSFIEKEFDEEKNQTLLQKQLKSDTKNNSQMYGPTSKYGVDFAYLGKQLLNLFKKKKKDEITTINYEHLVYLFKNSDLFNDELLYTHLKIPEGYKYVFYSFCESRQMDTDLLSPNNHLQLLEDLTTVSNDFLKVLYEDDKKLADQN